VAFGAVCSLNSAAVGHNLIMSSVGVIEMLITSSAGITIQKKASQQMHGSVNTGKVLVTANHTDLQLARHPTVV